MELQDLPVSASMVETFHIIRPTDLNPSGRLFGGTLMSWIDEVAGLVGLRHSRMNVVTGSVDNLKFLHGAFVKDTIVIKGKVTHVGNTSMEVKVETYVEHVGGERELINRAFLTLVGLDEEGKPTRLPRLILETDEDRQEWERAEMRRQIRRQEKADGFHFYGQE